MKKLLMALTFVSAVAATTALAGYKANKVNVKAYPNSKMLISAEDAVKLIGKKGVMFVSGDSGDNYKNSHVRGSVEMYAHHLHHSDIMGNMHCAPLYRCIEEAEKYIGHKGIDNDTLIIAYDDFKGPNATGVYSFFKSFGHKKVKILMGGWKALKIVDPNAKKIKKLAKAAKKHKKAAKKAKKTIGAYAKNMKRLAKAKKANDAKKIAKYEKKVAKGDISAAKKAKLKALIKSETAKSKAIEAKIYKMAAVVSSPKLSKEDEKKYDIHHQVAMTEKAEGVTPKHYRINKKRLNFKSIAGKAEVLHAVNDIKKRGKRSKYVIVDARGMTEIIGERKMDNVARGGHIPGATFLEWKNISDAKRGVAFKSKKELAKVLKKFGITKNKTVYAYCQVGAGRGSEIITALEIMGYKNAKVYTGSWDEWGNDMMLPIKR